jgi:hypothetical protein
MAKVIVRIRIEIAESIEGIPTDMFIEVRNYDVANVSEDLLSKDADGQLPSKSSLKPADLLTISAEVERLWFQIDALS